MLSALTLLVSLFIAQPALALSIDPESLSPADLSGSFAFATELNGEYSPFGIRTVTMGPGETLNITAEEDFDVRPHVGEAVSLSSTEWSWTAPEEPGHYLVDLYADQDMKLVRINAFVTHSQTGLKKGKINGYRIGKYPRGEGVYAAPTGFIEVTRDNEDTWISPHFQLKQFICKQKSGYPKYILVQERLLIKLEMILAAVNEIGFPAKTLTVMSGFRTPAHNHRRGKRNSRHMFGDAADIIVDSDEDGKMDDLNDDGRMDTKDSGALLALIESLESNYEFVPTGGIGTYAPMGSHGPFIHVDARGYSARWEVMRKSRKGKKRRGTKRPNITDSRRTVKRG